MSFVSDKAHKREGCHLPLQSPPKKYNIKLAPLPSSNEQPSSPRAVGMEKGGRPKAH